MSEEKTQAAGISPAKDIVRTSLKGVDGMRALACAMVMGHHAFQRLSLPAMPAWFQPFQLFFLQGNAGVSVFFVLSGFLLATPFWEAWLDGKALPSLGDYARRRAARIVPGYYLNILVTFAIAFFLLGDKYYQPWPRLAAGLTFTAGFNWVTLFPVEINGPLWSIGFEVFSYVLLPLFMLGLFALPFFRRRRRILPGMGWWCAVLLIVILANEAVNRAFVTDSVMKGWQYGMVGGAKYWMPRYNPLGFFGHYTLGILAAGANIAWQRNRLARQAPGKTQEGSWIAEILVWAGLTLMTAILWSCKSLPEFSFSIGAQPYMFPWFALAIALVLVCLPQSRMAFRIWDNPVSKFVSTISFGLYIWHYLFMELAAGKDYRYFGMTDPAAWALRTAVIFGAAILVAWFSWTFFEKPIVERARNRARESGT